MDKVTALFNEIFEAFMRTLRFGVGPDRPHVAAGTAGRGAGAGVHLFDPAAGAGAVRGLHAAEAGGGRLRDRQPPRYTPYKDVE
jgi:hypothetical protein